MQQKSHLVLVGVAIMVIGFGLCSPQFAGQDRKATSLQFDVASIKQPNPNDLRKFIDMRNGRFVTQNRTVKEIMSFAYRVEALQVSGGPDWADTEGFDIEAKSEMNPTAQQFLEMVKS